MHIAVLFEFPTLNGGERSMLAVMDELVRQAVGFRFTALTPPAGPLADALRQRGIPQVPWSVREFSPNQRAAGVLDAALLNVLRELRPNLVHGNSLSMGRLLGRIAERLEVPSSAHLRDIIGLSETAAQDLNRNARLIAVSDAVHGHFCKEIDDSRIVVIHNGVDLTEFTPRPATGCLHRELKLPDEARFCAAIGQIILRKGWNVLAEAAILVAQRLPFVHFLLIGARHSEKDETRRHEAAVHELLDSAGLKDRVHWLGERDDIPRLLNEIDLLVHSAHQEPLGRVLIEGSACGIPIVATDVGGTREIIEPEITGRLVPPNDPPALAAAMIAVLSDRELADRFRAAARRRAELRFDIRDSAARLFSCWSKVCEHGQRH